MKFETNQYGELVADSEGVKELIRLGYKQTSKRHQTVTRLPFGMTGIEALRIFWKTHDLDEWAATCHFLRVYARSWEKQNLDSAERLTVILNMETFRLFKKLGGETA